MPSAQDAVQRHDAGGYLAGTQIEVVNAALARGHYRAALFDFDGTLSLIREGWQGVMIPMMVDILAATPRAEAREHLAVVVEEFVTRLTGKQTIYQMIELAEQVAKRGGEPLPAAEYKREYLDRLLVRIAHRREGLRAGQLRAVDMLVPGSLELLGALRERGIKLYCASGTDHPYVLEEAALLGVAQYFGEHIYGAVEDYHRVSKAAVIQWIIAEHDLRGSQLLAFGDGFVEIENTKEVGGTAVGVASDEVSRQGIDAWKRERLIGAGADIIIPDYREGRLLLDYLFKEETA
jgi:phosphoglycolate phosphatase-like HAD superfamily hydrolase